MIIRKSDFFLSGAVETALAYYHGPMIGADSSVNEVGIVINMGGLSRFYIGKRGILAAKNEWLEMNTSDLKKKYKLWKQKWDKYDLELYNWSTNPKINWKERWLKLEEIGRLFWLESYKVETTDPFADELETLIVNGLKKKKIDVSLLHELISPHTPTLTQQMVIDRHRVKNGTFSKKEYLQKYWYSHGNWKGGEVLSENIFNDDLQIEEVMTDFNQRKKLHEKYDKLFDNQTRKTVDLLRVLFLWREERKALLQKTNIALSKVIDDASAETGIEPNLLAWARPEEIYTVNNMKEKINIFRKRKDKSVYVNRNSELTAEYRLGIEADKIIDDFNRIDKVHELKGTVASPGKAKGRVRIVLREHHFNNFMTGEILITTMTRPEFIPLMMKAAAIVTDEGGLTSHASIIARELKKPCVVGTKYATQIFENGDLVEVDADKGIVRKIKEQ